MNPSEPSNISPQVLIAGAGPTGLVLALWLTRLGVGVRIIDRTAEPGTTSRAVGIAARTLELYRQMGLADALVEGGVKVPAVSLWVRGKRAARLVFHRMGKGLSPFDYALVYPQDAHERMLIERLETAGVSVERQTELVGFDLRSDGVHATIRRPDGAEETCHAAYLAGCDGARSTVREGLRPAFRAEPIRTSSTSRTCRRAGRPRTATLISISTTRISSPCSH